ncbi:693_t:CDS:2 [Dentiscutata heterogama]|uniref:693_t:CDS:1 n=1 Tax=Dentiscutata heterogama TaxID=1316150 RepID=A0ACA9NXK8_9GLOM|nr:693_t:CDS:2 [Dentiscutata heterogama]
MSDDSSINVLDDPFFVSSKKRKQKISNEERIEADRKRAELELLVMDDEEENKHFDMKEIIKNEKKKRKRKNKKDFQEDTFDINVNDPRFAALHESHHFAIDPTNPQFKKTKSMSKLLEEQRRQARSKETSDFN